MPRIQRGQQGGYAYHVINRGNGRTTVFHKPQDYEVFLSLRSDVKTRHGVKSFGFCLMPNHFHVLLEPAHQTALSQFMLWLLTSHVRRYHQHYGGSGHVWKGRFKGFPVQRDEHLITVLRYVLQNLVRAGLLSTPREWLWSSLRRPQVVDPWPAGDERQWLEQLDEPILAEQLVNVRECLNWQRPYGRTGWQVKMPRCLDSAARCARAASRETRRKVTYPLLTRLLRMHSVEQIFSRGIALFLIAARAPRFAPANSARYRSQETPL